MDLTEVLRRVSGARPISAEWRETPPELKDQLGTQDALRSAGYFRDRSRNSYDSWIQHGDLSIENMFLDQETGVLTVLDWSDLAAGFPPLYDFFGFLTSAAYLPPSNESTRFTNDLAFGIASFRATFLSDTGFARTAETLILRACERFKIDAELIPALLIEFLIIRTHYYYRRDSVVQHQLQLRLLQLCMTQEFYVFGKYRLVRMTPHPQE